MMYPSQPVENQNRLKTKPVKKSKTIKIEKSLNVLVSFCVRNSVMMYPPNRLKTKPVKSQINQNHQNVVGCGVLRDRKLVVMSSLGFATYVNW